MKKLTLCLWLFAMAHLPVLAQTVTLTASDYNGLNISCFGLQDGSITATVTGGTPPYYYEWSNGDSTATISGLGEGYYNVRVWDATLAGSPGFAEITLTQPEPLTIDELRPYVYNNGYNVSAFGVCNGSVTTTISGGTSPYTYLWEPGAANGVVARQFVC